MKERQSQENFFAYCAAGARWKQEMIYVSQGVSLRLITFVPAEEKGNPAIVFIAGWITLIEAWQEVLQDMTADYRIYYLETREKISSQVKGKAGYSVEVIGKDIVNFLEIIQEKNYVLLGSSLGATAIIDCFRFMKNKPRALILISPNAEFRVPKIWAAVVYLFYPPLYQLLKPAVKWYLQNFRLDTHSDSAQYEKYSRALDAADPWKLKKAVLSLRKYRIWDFLSAIDVPALFIGASKDSLHEPEKVRKMTQSISKAKIRDLETNRRTHGEEMVREMRLFLRTEAGL